MPEELNELLSCFDKALKNKENKTFDKSDVKAIYEAASHFFRDDRSVSDDDLTKIRDKWVALAGEKIDKGRAQKKLHGTSRAEAIQAVLNSML